MTMRNGLAQWLLKMGEVILTKSFYIVREYMRAYSSHAQFQLLFYDSYGHSSKMFWRWCVLAMVFVRWIVPCR